MLGLIAFWPLLAKTFNTSINEMNTSLTLRMNEINGSLDRAMWHWQDISEKCQKQFTEASEKFNKVSDQLKELDVKFQEKLDAMQANFNDTYNELRERNLDLEERLDDLTERINTSLLVPTTKASLTTTATSTSTKYFATTSAPIATINNCSQAQEDGIYVLESGEEVFCSSGFLIFQRRMDGSVPDFHNRTWEEYVEGFGNKTGEFWFGLEKLHQITLQGNCRLRVDLESFDGNVTYAEYSEFLVANETDLFRLTVGGYNGTAGDGLDYHNGMAFSTEDRDNDLLDNSNCAIQWESGGWWYMTCFHVALNGVYGETSATGHSMKWNTSGGTAPALKFTQMGVRCK